MASPGSQSYTDIRSYSAMELVCSAQPYGTVPYSHGTLDACPATEPTESHGGRLGIQYSPFP